MEMWRNVCALMLLTSIPGYAQFVDSTFNLLDTIQIEAKYIASDRLANLYVVSSTNEVIKYVNGKEQFRFNNNTLGDLSLIDATDPFNLLLYYPDFQTAILLDRTMNETNRFDFLTLGVPSVSTVALSNDNQVWYYDELDFKLKKIDDEGQVSAQSEDLSLILGRSLNIKQIKARGNWVFLNDTELGILVFDQFGQLHRQAEQTTVIDFQVIGNFLILEKADGFYQYNWEFEQISKLPIPKHYENYTSISWQQQYLFMRTPQRINIFSF